MGVKSVQGLGRSLFSITLPVASSMILYLLAPLTPATAQISPDGTLPTNVTRSDNVFEITGGATAGTNLFHSFREFSVPTGNSAYFNNASTIQNIFSRVTGSSISNIDGLLRANGTVNLYLINPKGIIFGPNASLNIGGSFVASTASAIAFADGTVFSASDPSTPPLLTINIPTGLQYRENAGSIQVQGSRLSVPNGKTLALVGGNLSLDGASFETPGSQVELGGVAGTATVGLSTDANNLSLSFPAGVALADVSLSNGATANVSASGGGSIAINAQNLNMTGGSSLRAGIGFGLGSPQSKAGDIEINATGAINLTNSALENSLASEAEGQGGSITITSRALSLAGGATLVAHTFGQGNAGNVTINATDAVSMDGSSTGIGSQVFENAVGNGGSINITTRDLSVADGATLITNTSGQGNGGSINITTGDLAVAGGATLVANTFGRGNAGNVTISATESASFDGVGSKGQASAIGSQVFDNAVGDGGSIDITTRTLSVSGGAQLITNTYGRGNAGNVKISATDAVSVDGRSTGIGSQVFDNAVGDGGGIDITTGTLSVSGGAQLIANTYGRGNAGNVKISATDAISMDGRSTGIGSQVFDNAVGNGGDINITAEALAVTNGAQLTASTGGKGDGGNVNINARDRISFDGASTGVSSRVETTAEGKGGVIGITTGLLSVTNGAGLSVSSAGNGAAGNIEVQADSIRLNNRASINADTKGGQGDINLNSADLVLRRGSNITTNATGSNVIGGNIKINTDILVALENSDIAADSADFRGGNVTVTARGIFGTAFRPNRTPNSDITATGRDSSLNGTVQINLVGVDPSRDLAALPETVVDPNALIAQNPCEQGKGSAFTVTGRGGLPPNPSDALNTDTVRVGLVEPALIGEQGEEGAGEPRPIQNLQSKIHNPIVPAQGWVFNENGEVVLTAYNPNSSQPQRPWTNPAACPAP